MKFSTSALDTVNLTGVPARGQMACGIKEVYRAFTFAMTGEDIADLINKQFTPSTNEKFTTNAKKTI